MVDRDKAQASLRHVLALTQELELDCEAFTEHLAAYVDGRLPGTLCEQVQHHAKLCEECGEELQILLKALDC